jgi:hypothetical protein
MRLLSFCSIFSNIINLVKVTVSDADPDSAGHFDAGPDLSFQSNADPDPSFQIKAENLEVRK